MSTPLLNAPVYSGRITRAGGTEADEIVSQALGGAGLGCLEDERPYAVFVTSGTAAGFSFRVTGKTARGLRVDCQGIDLAQLLEAGDTFDLRPLHTLSSLFGSTSAEVRFAASADPLRADQLLVSRGGTWHAYWFTGTAWRRTGKSGDAGEDVLLPQDALVVYRRGTDSLDVRFLGDAPATDAVVAVPAGIVSSVANPFPADVALAELGLETVSGWQCGATPELADQVQLCLGNTWRTFWHDGSGWRCTSGADADATVPAGAGMIIVRKPAPSSAPFTWITRPYSL